MLVCRDDDSYSEGEDVPSVPTIPTEFQSQIPPTSNAVSEQTPRYTLSDKNTSGSPEGSVKNFIVNRQKQSDALNRKPSQVTRRTPSSASTSQFRSSTYVPVIKSNSAFNPYASTSSNSSNSSNPKSVPSLFLPSQQRRNRPEEQPYECEDDSFRHSTASFVTAAEEPSLDDNSFITGGTESLNQNHPLENHNSFDPQLGSSRNVLSESVFGSQMDHNNHSQYDDDDRHTLNGSKTPTLSSSHTTPKLHNDGFPSNEHINKKPSDDELPASDRTDKDFHGNVDLGSSRIRRPFADAPLDSTLRVVRDPNEKNVSVEELARSISEEFAMPEFTQPIPSDPIPGTSSFNSSKTNLNSAAANDRESPQSQQTNHWAQKQSFPEYDEDDEYNEDYDDTVKSADIKQDLSSKNEVQKHEATQPKEPESSHCTPKETPQFEYSQITSKEASKPEPSQITPREISQPVNTPINPVNDNNQNALEPPIRPRDMQRRDFSLTTYLDDFYNDSDDDDFEIQNQVEHPSEASLAVTGISKNAKTSDHHQTHNIPAERTNMEPYNSYKNFPGAEKSSSTIDTLIKDGEYNDSSPRQNVKSDDSDDDIEILDTAPAVSNRDYTPSQDRHVEKTNKLASPVGSFASPLLEHKSSRTFDDYERSSTPSGIQTQSIESRFAPQNTHTLNHNQTSPNTFTPLPLPSNRFGGESRFSTASDSLRSFGGFETDDTASLSTGRNSPQSFIHSNRESYDFRVNPLNSSNVSKPGTSDYLSRIDSNGNSEPDSLPLPNGTSTTSSAMPRLAKWKQLDFISEPDDLTVSSTGSVRAVAGTDGKNSPAPGIDQESEFKKRANGSSSDLLGSSRPDDQTSSLAINETHRLPSFSTYADTDNAGPSGLESQTSQKQNMDIVTSGFSQTYDNDTKETPVTSEQNALVREINDLFSASTSTKNTVSNRSESPASFIGGEEKMFETRNAFTSSHPDNSAITQRSTGFEREDPNEPASKNVNGFSAANDLKDSLSVPGGRPAVLNVEKANSSYSDNRPSSNMFSSPITPMEPDPVIAELYQDPAQLLSRPVSRFLDTDAIIPQTQPLSPSRTCASANADGGKSTLDASSNATTADEITDRLDAKINEFSKTDGNESDGSSSPGNHSFTSSIDHDTKEEKDISKSPSKGHHKTDSIGIRSLSMKDSPPLSPVQSSAPTESSFGKLVRKSSLMSLKGIALLNKAHSSGIQPISRAGTNQSLSSRLNRPPIIDFLGVLSRSNSVGRKETFDAARRAQLEYDSGLQTWLAQVSTDHKKDGLSLVSTKAPGSSGSGSSSGGSASAMANSIKKPQFLKAATNSMPSSRKMTSALNEVSNKTHGLANMLHINMGSGKSSSGAKGFFSRGKKLLKTNEKPTK